MPRGLKPHWHFHCSTFAIINRANFFIVINNGVEDSIIEPHIKLHSLDWLFWMHQVRLLSRIVERSLWSLYNLAGEQLWNHLIRVISNEQCESDTFSLWVNRSNCQNVKIHFRALTRSNLFLVLGSWWWLKVKLSDCSHKKSCHLWDIREFLCAEYKAHLRNTFWKIWHLTVFPTNSVRMHYSPSYRSKHLCNGGAKLGMVPEDQLSILLATALNSFMIKVSLFHWLKRKEKKPSILCFSIRFSICKSGGKASLDHV